MIPKKHFAYTLSSLNECNSRECNLNSCSLNACPLDSCNLNSCPSPYYEDKSRGAVLIIVLIVLSSLSLLAVEFSRYAFLDHALSVSTRSVLSSKLLAESAEHFIGALLIEHYNAEQKDDAEPLDLEKSELIWSTFSAEFEAAEFAGKLGDENSRFPLNRIFSRYTSDLSRAESSRLILQRLLANLFELHGYDGGELELQSLAEGVVTAMLQWGGGGEIDEEEMLWYLEQEPQRLPPKRPFENPQELWLMHWPDVSDELLSLILKGTETIPSFLDIITVWSIGPMNINTMHPIIIAALPTNSSTKVDFTNSILEARKDEATTEDSNWYNEIFEQYGGIPLPIGIIGSRTRVYRLELDIGVGARKARLLSIGIVTYEKVRWRYRTIQ